MNIIIGLALFASGYSQAVQTVFLARVDAKIIQQKEAWLALEALIVKNSHTTLAISEAFFANHSYGVFEVPRRAEISLARPVNLLVHFS